MKPVVHSKSYLNTCSEILLMTCVKSMGGCSLALNSRRHPDRMDDVLSESASRTSSRTKRDSNKSSEIVPSPRHFLCTLVCWVPPHPIPMSGALSTPPLGHLRPPTDTHQELPPTKVAESVFSVGSASSRYSVGQSSVSIPLPGTAIKSTHALSYTRAFLVFFFSLER